MANSPFDTQCGTFYLQPFRLPHEECPDRFICSDGGKNVESTSSAAVVNDFGDCIDAMNCRLTVSMTQTAPSPESLGAAGKDGIITMFGQQMIPHHQNAVNMAKALLKTQMLECNEDDLTVNPQSNDCM